MIRSRRRRSLPDDIARRLGRADAPLAATELTDDRWACAGRRALVVAGQDGDDERYPWHEAEHGRWDGERRTFTVTWVDRERAPLVLTTTSDDVADFTDVMRERIQSSVVYTETADLPAGGSARVFIRRDEQGELVSQLTVAGRLRADEEEGRQIDALERRARGAVGLPT